MTDDSPVYHALIVHLSRAKLIAHFDDEYAVAKFSQSLQFRKRFQRKVPLFVNISKFRYIMLRDSVKEASTPKTSVIQSHHHQQQNVVALQRAEMRMVRWMWGVKLKRQISK